MFWMQPVAPWTTGIFTFYLIPPYSFLPFFLPPPWLVPRFYQRHLEVRNPVRGNNWSYSIHQTVSKLMYFGGFLSHELFQETALFYLIITHIISRQNDWCDIWGNWSLPINPDRIWWQFHTRIKRFWAQSIVSWTATTFSLKKKKRKNAGRHETTAAHKGMKGDYGHWK